MAVIEINRNPSRRDLAIFGGILAIATALLGAWLRWRVGSLSAAIAVWVVGGATLLAYGLVPALRRPLYLGWIYAFFPLGWVLSHVVLALIFYLLFTPIGLLLRVLGRDPMTRRFEPDQETYWVTRSGPVEASRYLRQF